MSTEATSEPTVDTLAADLYRIAQGVTDPQSAARQVLKHHSLPCPPEPPASYTLVEVAEMLDRYAESCVDPYKTHHGYAAATLRDMASGEDGVGSREFVALR